MPAGGAVAPQLQGWRWYSGLAAVCFAAGAAMELFMIKTGFYDKVTAIEAERRQAVRERMEQLAQLSAADTRADGSPDREERQR
eukprot:SM000085S23298  [mRNA]  locus=s85:531018:531647:- [translate_table: standard]